MTCALSQGAPPTPPTAGSPAAEAIAWLGQPLSPAELHALFECQISLSLIAYHVNGLKDLGAIEEVDSLPARGARETFCYFAGGR